MVKVSILKYPTIKGCHWIPITGHPCDHAPITQQILRDRTNHDQELCCGKMDTGYWRIMRDPSVT